MPMPVSLIKKSLSMSFWRKPASSNRPILLDFGFRRSDVKTLNKLATHLRGDDIYRFNQRSLNNINRRQAGFSLIEMIVVIVVLALALTGVTLVINETVRQSPKPLVQTQAMELAQTYLDEILPKRFDENSGQGGIPRCDSTDNAAQACSNSMSDEEGGNRLLFDDVDDYNGLDNQPPVLISGSTPPNFNSYRVQVSVSYAGADLGLANRGAKRITVTITTPLGTTLPVSAYRVNF